jgi:hypothetical protein
VVLLFITLVVAVVQPTLEEPLALVVEHLQLLKREVVEMVLLVLETE